MCCNYRQISLITMGYPTVNEDNKCTPTYDRSIFLGNQFCYLRRDNLENKLPVHQILIEMRRYIIISHMKHFLI